MSSTGSRPDALPKRSRRSLLLFVYPIVLYFLLASGKPPLAFLGNASLAVLILLPALASRSLLAWLLLPVAVSVAGYAAFGGHEVMVVWLPQILVAGLLGVLFGRTLRPGSVPLVTRIAFAIRGDDPAGVPLAYTRGVTILWLVIFALLVIEGLLFIAFEPAWSPARASLVTYGVIAVVIICEYVFHNIRYPHPSHRGLADFLRHVAQIDYRRLLAD